MNKRILNPGRKTPKIENPLLLGVASAHKIKIFCFLGVATSFSYPDGLRIKAGWAGVILMQEASHALPE